MKLVPVIAAVVPKPSPKRNENSEPISSDGVAPKQSMQENSSMSMPNAKLSPDLKAWSAKVSVSSWLPSMLPETAMSDAARPL